MLIYSQTLEGKGIAWCLPDSVIQEINCYINRAVVIGVCFRHGVSHTQTNILTDPQLSFAAAYKQYMVQIREHIPGWFMKLILFLYVIFSSLCLLQVELVKYFVSLYNPLSCFTASHMECYSQPVETFVSVHVFYAVPVLSHYFVANYESMSNFSLTSFFLIVCNFLE